jgi:hypothetical protein
MILHPDIIDAMIAAGATAVVIAAAYRAAHTLETQRDAEIAAEEERKRIARRPAAARRQRTRRERAIGDMFERDDEQRYIDAAIAAEKASHAESRRKESPPIPPKETTSSLRSSEVVRGGSRAQNGSVLKEALDLADEVLGWVDIEPCDCPPGWCGAAMTIQKFLNQGCPLDVIRLAIRAELARIQAAPERFGWFERPIARAFANHQRGTPTVEVINGGRSGKRTGAVGRTYGRSHGSASDAAADLRRELTRQAEEVERAAAGMDRGARRVDDGMLPA